MAYFCTDYLAIWVQRSPVEWPIKGPLCHFICIYLPSTEDHNKKLNSSKKIKLWKLSGETMQCSTDKGVISTVYKVLTALFQLNLSTDSCPSAKATHSIFQPGIFCILKILHSSLLNAPSISIPDFDNSSHSLPWYYNAEKTNPFLPHTAEILLLDLGKNKIDSLSDTFFTFPSTSETLQRNTWHCIWFWGVPFFFNTSPSNQF